MKAAISIILVIVIAGVFAFCAAKYAIEIDKWRRNQNGGGSAAAQ